MKHIEGNRILCSISHDHTSDSNRRFVKDQSGFINVTRYHKLTVCVLYHDPGLDKKNYCNDFFC